MRRKIKIFTCHRGEVDADQQGKEAGDVSQHIAVCIGQWVVLVFHWIHIIFGNQVPLLIVDRKQVLWMGERDAGKNRVNVSCRHNQIKKKGKNMLSVQIYIFIFRFN